MKWNVVMIALALSMGCSKSESGEPAKDEATKDTKAATGSVTVPEEGKKFEPPIKPEQLPSGAWYCDMGTVHYAQMKEGDKTCPVCQMKLKKNP